LVAGAQLGLKNVADELLIGWSIAEALQIWIQKHIKTEQLKNLSIK
jgi:hypothetical protein